MSLINLQDTQQFLTSFASENDCSLIFLASNDGGLICSNDIAQGRMVIEALSAVWQTLPNKKWKRILLEWEYVFVILINCDDWIFGLQQLDPNPTTFGLLLIKAELCAKHIKTQFNK